MKVDVEGHELAVFEGAGATLSGRTFPDVVSEEFCAYPASTASDARAVRLCDISLGAAACRPRTHATKSFMPLPAHGRRTTVRSSLASKWPFANRRMVSTDF